MYIVKYKQVTNDKYVDKWVGFNLLCPSYLIARIPNALIKLTSSQTTTLAYIRLSNPSALKIEF